MKTLLEIKNLSVQYHGSKDKAIVNFGLHVTREETIGIVGESGSGKTSIALAIMGLLQQKANVEGSMVFSGQNMKLNRADSFKEFRWKKIALVFQNTLQVLNPMMKIYKQVLEPMMEHYEISKENAKQKAESLLNEVGLDCIWWEAYPHQLSGGMRQKVLIAMALACDPELLIVDEPTMSLDPKAKMQIINLLKEMQKKHHFGLIVISHEMKIIEELCSKIHVLYQGYLLEYGDMQTMIKMPKHPYTKGLLNASWEIDSYRDIWGIPQKIRAHCEGGCPFYQRCFQAKDICKSYQPSVLPLQLKQEVACIRDGIALLLQAKNIVKTYKIGKQQIYAAKHIDFEVYEGEILAVIGESGSGKSTIANILAGFERQDDGEIRFGGQINHQKHWMQIEDGIQMIVQDPASAMNPLWTIREVIEEPMKINLRLSKEEMEEKIKSSFAQVQLPFHDAYMKRSIHELSGGQKQRVLIARALVMRPKLLIADEMSAMLDPSNAANMIRMLRGLQNKNGFSLLYITHDLYLARKIADRVLQLHKGRMIDYGNAGEILDAKIMELNHNHESKDGTKQQFAI